MMVCTVDPKDSMWEATNDSVSLQDKMKMQNQVCF